MLAPSAPTVHPGPLCLRDPAPPAAVTPAPSPSAASVPRDGTCAATGREDGPVAPTTQLQCHVAPMATLPSLQLSPLHPSCPPVPQVPAIPPGFERPPSTADVTSLPAAAAIEPPAAAGHALEPIIPLSQARRQPIYQEVNRRLRKAPISSTPTPSAAPLPERQAAAPEGAEQYLPPELYALALASEEDVPEDDPLWDSA